MEENKNLNFWMSVEKTDPKHTKKASVGTRSFTAINAQQQLMNATKQWGMYGKTWGLKDVKLNYINGLINDQILAVAQGIFWYPEGFFDIGSSILVQAWYSTAKYNKVDDDFLKKLETDMTTKALSKLGFNADVFLGKYDDNKYITRMNEVFAENKKDIEEKKVNILPELALKSEQYDNIIDLISKGLIKKIESVEKRYILSNEIKENLLLEIDNFEKQALLNDELNKAK